MDKRLGSSAGFFALIALLLHTFGYLGTEGGSDKGETKKTGTSAAAGAAQGGSGDRILEKQGPWRATQQYRRNDIVDAQAAGCQSFLLGLPQPACSQGSLLSLFGFDPTFDPDNLHFLIATIADPLHTRMAIETDRDLDAIQRAAFRSDWELATQWLPWTLKPAATQAPPGSASRDQVDLENYPGLLVFRHHFRPELKSEELLMVLVVAETPTAGVNGFQFDTAKRIVSALKRPSDRDIYIAGPLFSGSFLSFTEMLRDWPGAHRFNVHSGTVSNSDYANQMLRDFDSKQRAKQEKSSIVFHGSTLPSASFEAHFASLVTRWGLRPDQAAELNEDETGFSFSGPANSKGNSSIPIYRYPRDVAQVRNNYNDAAFAASPGKNDAAVPQLEFSLRDTQLGEDIFPMFSTSHTPFSQNAELRQTIFYLKRKGVRLASLSATNIFDTIFLANLLTRTCPDIRLVVRGPDLLFVQEAAEGSLSGLMAISPFPLFPEGRAWSGADTSDVMTFASADQAGEYNAVVSLLRQQQGKQEAPLQPYERAEGAAGDDHAPVLSAWLLELGRSGWLPIDLLPQINPPVGGPDPNAKWFDQRDLAASGFQQMYGPVPLRTGWTALCGLCALFTLSFCVRLLYLWLNPRKLVWSNLCLADIARAAKATVIEPVAHHRYMLMLSCFSTLVLINGLLLCPMLAMQFRFNAGSGYLLPGVVGISLLTPLVIALLLSLIVPFRIAEAAEQEGDKSSRYAWESIGIRLGVLGLPFTALASWWSCCASGSAGFLLCFRTLSLNIPVAPLWPLLLASCGLFALFYFHLRRFTWAYRRQPHLDTSTFDRILCNEFERLKQGLERNLYRPTAAHYLTALPKSIVVSMAMVGLLFFLVPAYGMRSFEPGNFTWIFKAMLIPLAVFSTLTFLRFLRCWGLLRAFLASLNSVLLGKFFNRVPEFGGSGPVWIREVKLISLATAGNSAIALHNMSKIGFAETPKAEYLVSLRNFLSLSQKPASQRLEFIRTYDAFCVKANEIAKTLSNQVLKPFWQENELPYVGEAGSEEESAILFKATASRKDLPLALAAAVSSQRPVEVMPAMQESPKVSADVYAYAARYVALQYSVFIGYILLHLQNLLLCCTTCFVFIVLAVKAFAFQIPQAALYFLTVVMIGGAVLVLNALAQMERDPIMSRLSGTKEGELGSSFYWRAVGFGALPVLSLLSTQFPTISRFLTEWVEPALSKIQ